MAMEAPSIIASTSPPISAFLPAALGPAVVGTSHGGRGDAVNIGYTLHTVGSRQPQQHATHGRTDGRTDGPLMASRPPVHAPDRMAFQGSSFLRTAAMEQSKLAKQRPHTANAPGRGFMCVRMQSLVRLLETLHDSNHTRTYIQDHVNMFTDQLINIQSIKSDQGQRTAHDRCAGLDGGDTPAQALPLRGVSQALEIVPDAAPDGAHAEGAAHIVHDAVRAGLAACLGAWIIGRMGEGRSALGMCCPGGPPCFGSD